MAATSRIKDLYKAVCLQMDRFGTVAGALRPVGCCRAALILGEQVKYQESPHPPAMN